MSGIIISQSILWQITSWDLSLRRSLNDELFLNAIIIGKSILMVFDTNTLL